MYWVFHRRSHPEQGLLSQWRLPPPVTKAVLLIMSYPLRSHPLSCLQLHSPLQTPHWQRRTNPLQLVSDSIDASTEMSGVETDPDSLSNSGKLTCILAQITTINTRLDSHGQRLTLLEKTVTDQAAILAMVAGADHSGAGSFGDQVLPAGSSGAKGAGGSATGTVGQGVKISGGTVLPTGRRGQGGSSGQGTLDSGHFPRDRSDDAGSHRPKINFPNYDDESDPLPWLNKRSTYFRGMGTAPEELIWMASLHLDGVAVEWYYELKRDVGLLPWIRFYDFINMRFDPPLCTNGLANLKDLRCTGTMEEYQHQFLQLLCCCDDMTPL
jgi:hypothetical protein